MAETVTAAEIGAAFEGIYAMEAWHDGDRVDHPPQVEGRWVLLRGQVVSFLFKTADDRPGQTIAVYGRYHIEDGAFSYGYDGGSYFLVRAGGAVDPFPIPVGEVRRFEASREGGGLMLAMADGTAAFRVTDGTVEYIEAGKIQRRWRRIATS
jgi:hypothetical protein